MAINPKILNEGEQLVLSTRTHSKALIIPALLLLVILALAVLADKTFVGGTFSWGLWGIATLLALWFGAKPFLEWMTSTYTMTDRRLITRTGIITRRGHDIPLTRISDVAYERDLIDRMLGCGTLIVSDASTNGRVLLHDIPDVEEAQRRLNELLHDRDTRSGSHDGT
ncbi:MAG: PH domain-containing protein [Nocardioidaceae bacterium]|nr:PH domain-containing protein [Nocardioidaceae bacterium]